MNRRDFVGVLLMGLAGTLLGCSRKPTADPTMDPGRGPDHPPESEVSGAGQAGDASGERTEPEHTEQGSGDSASAAKQMVKCPKCHAENEVALDADGNPVEITCWKCGYKWTPTLQ